MRKSRRNIRDRSCRLRCSLLLKARAQYWHLYFLSGCAREAFRGTGVVAASAGGTTATLAPGILAVVEDDVPGRSCRLSMAVEGGCRRGTGRVRQAGSERDRRGISLLQSLSCLMPVLVRFFSSTCVCVPFESDRITITEGRQRRQTTAGYCCFS